MQIELKILNKEFYKVPFNPSHCTFTPGLPNNDLPSYATSGSAAVDLVCTEDVIIYPGETKQIHTGIAIHIGSHTDSALRAYREHWDYAGLLLPRSGLGTRGLVLANLVGLLDSDYQGELLVQAWNRLLDVSIQRGMTGYNNLTLKAGDRFAQLVILPIAKAQWEVVEEFSNNTSRGAGGFGSTL